MGVSHFDQVDFLCSFGVKIIQLRAKKKIFTAREVFRSIETACKFGVTLIINDDIEMAKSTQLHGVHIGKNDGDPIQARRALGSKKIIGQTIHSWDDAKYAKKLGVCNYAGIGPIRESETKKTLKPSLSTGEISKIIQFLDPLPCFLIGGLTHKDYSLIGQTGASGICVCSSISNQGSFGSGLNTFQENGFFRN